ncbi:hypothetical protein RDI58_026421 [Solanum bulbocastanum]|uniref:Glycosyltransferase n=1 Tax=Solanum bulbocastanum TaxID=147425 RepID=A0AAN8Y0U4_SOLBU
MKLASKGFTITFVNTESTHQRIAKAQSLKDDDNPFSHAEESGLDIHYARISDGFPLSFDRSANASQFMIGLTHVFQAHVDDFIENLVLSKPNPPVSCIITDKDLPSYCQDADPNETKYVFKCIEDAQKADIVIGNTVQELESSTILALQEQQPFYAIGPICPTNFTKKTISTNLLPATDYTNWLNSKQDGTVLYISFGSLVNLSKQDILEIAQGILISKVSFIWVLRHNILGSEERNILPLGFEEETAGRGLVVPWCSQLAVLSHPAVGGFLTHCGWNSILESVWCKVPMPHAVLVPLPLQGHITPFTHLAMKLASKGFTITFVNTESTHQQIAKAQSLKDDDNPFSHGQKCGLDIQYAKISDGFPLSFDWSANASQFVEDLPSYLQDADPSTVMHRFVFKCLEDAQKADFVIGNTVQELESSPISALQEKQPFYAIGPLFPTSFTKRTISTNLLPASDYTNWLNSKQDGTVLYISFGSLVNLSKQDILEIAQGILISKVEDWLCHGALN